MSLKNDGVDAEEHFRTDCFPPGSHPFIHTLVDTKRAGRLVQAQPSDKIVTYDGRTWYAEVKSTENPTVFLFARMLRIGQKGSANLVIYNRGDYWVHVRHELTKTWYHIPYQFLRDYPRQSIRWEHLDKFPQLKRLPYTWSPEEWAFTF